MVENIICVHREMIEEYHHYALGTCTLCGQIRRYDRLDDKQPVTIIKIGRIKGVQTMEHPPKEVIEVVKNKPEVDSIAQSEPEPVRRKYKARKARQLLRDYEANREAILEAYDSLTLIEFYAKWHFSSNTWTKLKREWGVKGKYERRSPTSPKSLPDTKAPEVHRGNPLVSLGTFTVEPASELPAFPEFNDQWSDFTKQAWFETYMELKKLEVRNAK